MPALALSAEPPARHVLDRPPARGHLIDRSLFARAFGILGSVEATTGRATFAVSFLAAGWRFGEPLPTGAAMLA